MIAVDLDSQVPLLACAPDLAAWHVKRVALVHLMKVGYAQGPGLGDDARYRQSFESLAERSTPGSSVSRRRSGPTAPPCDAHMRFGERSQTGRRSSTGVPLHRGVAEAALRHWVINARVVVAWLRQLACASASPGCSSASTPAARCSAWARSRSPRRRA